MFKCQENSFLKEIDTTVVACEPVDDVNGFIKGFGPVEIDPSERLYRIILAETVLFPEGGGQPDDRGTIGDFRVVRVIRDGASAVHYAVYAGNPQSKENLENVQPNGDLNNVQLQQGSSVKVTIDWNRRFDHMQQHSGQHLITAIADQMFGFATTSWYLGKEDSFIELDTKSMTDDQKVQIENAVNAKILEGIATSVEVVQLDDPKLKTARGRNLPADVTGNIRIVTMPGIESNVCCGTHVTNLWQLQQIKLLHTVPKKGKLQLYFVCGNRVSKRFDEMFKREVELGKILKTNPNDFASACDKLNLTLKTTRKNLLGLTKEVAEVEASEFVKKIHPDTMFYHFHRENVDAEYAPVFLREIKSVTNKVLFLSFKFDQTSGSIYLIRGENTVDEKAFESACEQVAAILDGKGSRRNNQYQAKISKCGAISKAVTLVQNMCVPI